MKEYKRAKAFIIANDINKKVKEKYPSFTPKDYGYKQVKLFFTNIKGVKVKDTNDLTVELP